ncbi:hypothetical protein [Vulgatibacter sp.]|uniref:hypothetical protein n=1 Tax=Vulgatibacter sp. TaxID=1971226 RepID=UPI003566154D
MPHRPEDTSTDRHESQRTGEKADAAIEGGHYRGPRPTGDTQPPAPANRSSPGKIPDHGGRR